jgi:CBS domain containing-hemolysin-like protein
MLAPAMSVTTVILQVLGVGVLVLLNAFFVASEFAIVKVRASEIEPLARGGSARARIARHIVGRLDSYLSASQLGITMTSLGLGWVGEPFVGELVRAPLELAGITQPAVLHAVAFTIAFSLITFLHIVVGEQAPKWYAIQYAKKTTLGVARPLHLFYVVFRPFIWVVNESANRFLKALGIQTGRAKEGGHSEEEIRLLLSTGSVFSGVGRSISLNALDFRERSVREVMVPRTNVVALFTNKTIQQNIATALENQFTRYPLCERNMDNVVGMIHLKDLFRLKGETGPGKDLMSIRREMLFVPETMPLETILNTFLTRRVLMATVVDEYGGTAGLVTLENVLEELVGDIRDEFDVENPLVQRVSDSEYLIDGSFSLHEFEQMFGIEPETHDVVTVSGYALQLLGRMPERGAMVTMANWQATVEAVQGKTVKTLRLKKAGESRGAGAVEELKEA